MIGDRRRQWEPFGGGIERSRCPDERGGGGREPEERSPRFRGLDSHTPVLFPFPTVRELEMVAQSGGDDLTRGDLPLPPADQTITGVAIPPPTSVNSDSGTSRCLIPGHLRGPFG